MHNTTVTISSSQPSQPKYPLAGWGAPLPWLSRMSWTSLNPIPFLNQSTAVKAMTTRIAPTAAVTVPTTPNSYVTGDRPYGLGVFPCGGWP